MTPSSHRIVVATVAAFVALVGMTSAVLSLFYDNTRAFSYGVAAMIVGIAVVVVAMKPASVSGE
ncbi:DUF2964 family protein [Caballeronia sp. AZ1_KS37]|uniref:DUF2964 family protein n=1 Tax=Caballeronia sp. AZ1_KS37 TaxID=2921756 RepID=UPI0020295904|nr:DUF2964 family protein [Caballeronia sp. AZ1_KS37]